MDMAYWYYAPGQQVYPDGLKFTMHDAIRKALYWFVYPPVITDEDLAWTGVFVVEATPAPDAPEGKVAVDAAPELVGGAWVQRWEVADAPPLEVVEPEPEPEPDPQDGA